MTEISLKIIFMVLENLLGKTADLIRDRYHYAYSVGQQQKIRRRGLQMG